MKTPTTCAVPSLFLALALALALILALIGGCGTDAADPADTAQLELNVELVGNTELAGIQIDVTRVYCEGEAPGPSGEPYEPTEAYQALEGLEEVRVTGSAPPANSAYAEGSTHPFSDHVFNVSVGCYDLVATPLRLVDGELVASEVCSKATRRGVYAAPQTANEFQLFSQCM